MTLLRPTPPDHSVLKALLVAIIGGGLSALVPQYKFGGGGPKSAFSNGCGSGGD
jgi:hypothetical protein